MAIGEPIVDNDVSSGATAMSNIINNGNNVTYSFRCGGAIFFMAYSIKHVQQY